MSEPSFERVKAVLGAARGLAPEERASFLAAECEDTDLRLEVESLLAEEDEPGFLDPARLGAASVLGALASTQPGDPETGSPLPGRVGRYRVVSLIGSGGMGTVYEAEQDHPRRRVALKMVRAGFASDEVLRRFEREAELLGRLQHPGIAQIYEAGTVDLGGGEQPFFAMELVDGLPLRRYVRERDLEREAILRLVVAICEAVQHAHEKGVVHRDLKPDNILVSDDHGTTGGGQPSTGTRRPGLPKVLDFGVARATDADVAAATLQTTEGQLVGTLPFMSPEQLDGGGAELDGRSDVYALGVILYELLTGRLPIDMRGQSFAHAARTLREEEPRRLSSLDARLRGDLETIVAKALEKQADRRYASAAELAADIERHLAHEPIAARPASRLYRCAKFARRHRALVTGTAIAFVALLAGLLLAVSFGLSEARQRGLAQARAADSRFADYRSSLVAAQAVLANDPRAAFDLLARAPEELRAWEWHHLNAQLFTSDAEYLHPAGELAGQHAGALSFEPDGAARYTFVSARGIERVELSSGARTLLVEDVVDAKGLCSTPDGATFAAIDLDGRRVRAWRLAPGAESPTLVLELAVDRASPWATLSADGSTLAFFEAGGDVRAFALDTGVERYRQPASGVSGLALWPDGSRCVVASRHHLGCVLIDASGVEPFHHQSVTLALGPRAQRVAHFGEESIRVTAVAGGELELTLGSSGLNPSALAIHPDGQVLAEARGDAIFLWSLESGERLASLHRPPDAARADELLFDRAGHLLERSDDGARLHRTTSSARRALDVPRRSYDLVAFHPAGRLVAACRRAGAVFVADAVTGALVAELDHGGDGVRGLAFSTDGTALLTLHQELARRWELPTDPLGGAWPDLGVEVEEDAYWSTTRAQRTRIVNFRLSDSAALSADGSLRIVATNGAYELFDEASGERLVRAEATQASSDARVRTCVRLSPDGELAATGHVGGDVVLWRARTGERLGSLEGHIGTIYSLAFSPDGSRLLSGGRDGTLRVWHVERRAELLVLRGHGDDLRSAQFSADGSRVVSCSRDGSVLVWDGAPPQGRPR